MPIHFRFNLVKKRCGCVLRSRSLWPKAILLVLLAQVLIVSPLRAAVELVRLEIVPVENRVRVEWETASEYNVSAFQLFYKTVDEPDAGYQAIGEPITPHGTLGEGAIYEVEFYQLQPNVSYCFRLQEITSNDEPGDVYERCGYGINQTPTPTITPTPTLTATPTATPVPTEAPTPTPPIPTPTPEPPTPTPEGTREGGVTVNIQPQATAEPQPQDATETPAPPPTYVVQTATPTATPVVIAPTPTQFPTATPTAMPDLVLVGQLFGDGTSPLSEMLVLLLCLGGLGLALLGVAALLGAVFYIRTRS